ncbi:ATP-dependent DNA helicase/nuclease subunit A [Ceratobasidium sp. AG-Ba]|nr:ATP-dependent DNA helicase/nuclease subunit A [Ceratobasidium sp. AG-Ba]
MPGRAERAQIHVGSLPTICSVCGVNEQRKADAYLLVRLCSRCRRQKLVEWRSIQPADLKGLVLDSDQSCFNREMGLRHSIRKEVENVRGRWNELKSLGDEATLETWRETLISQRGDIVARCLEKTRQKWTEEVKQEWRKQIEERIRKLGYVIEFDQLPPAKQIRWAGFYNRTDLFTEEKWEKLKPRVFELIETEARERPERERKQRRSNRNFQLRELFSALQAELDTLPDDFLDLSVIQQTTLLVNWLPLPDYADALKWPIFQGWLDEEIDSVEIETRFSTQRDEITRLILDWGNQVRRELANMVREGLQEDGLVDVPIRPRLPVGEGEKDPFDNADADASLLLRADSFFKNEEYAICSYDVLILNSRRNFDGIDWSSCTFNSEASAIARAFLTSLGRPDVSGPEFNGSSGEWFQCGRCQTHRKAWHPMIEHYHLASQDWIVIQNHLSNFSDLGIAYNNTHRLDNIAASCLLIQLSSQAIAEIDIKYANSKKAGWIEQVKESGIPFPTRTEQATADESNTPQSEEEGNPEGMGEEEEENEGQGYEDEGENDEESEIELWQRDRFACKLCERAQLEAKMFVFMDMLALFDHLRNVHNITDPYLGLDVEDRESIQESPYLRLAGEFEGLILTWGVTVSYG